jgi:uncharacterized OsmC-like protein
MKIEDLRALQAPLKALYRQTPEKAKITQRAQGRLNPARLSVEFETPAGCSEAGLHPATGGDGSLACSGDILLQSLAACAGVTLQAVAASMRLDLRGGTVCAEGDMDFRGTLAVDKSVPVGFTAIRLHFELMCDASPSQRETLLNLTERFCVVYQTLQNPPPVTASADVITST